MLTIYKHESGGLEIVFDKGERGKGPSLFISISQQMEAMMEAQVVTQTTIKLEMTMREITQLRDGMKHVWEEMLELREQVV